MFFWSFLLLLLLFLQNNGKENASDAPSPNGHKIWMAISWMVWECSVFHWISTFLAIFQLFWLFACRFNSKERYYNGYSAHPLPLSLPPSLFLCHTQTHTHQERCMVSMFQRDENVVAFSAILWQYIFKKTAKKRKSGEKTLIIRRGGQIQKLMFQNKEIFLILEDRLEQNVNSSTAHWVSTCQLLCILKILLFSFFILPSIRDAFCHQ